ncbi:MAG TPA: cupin domain-containing protein [Longimicrobium sp.]|nr:cupin domain-containing protein [Longimicrobium sp.]
MQILMDVEGTPVAATLDEAPRDTAGRPLRTTPGRILDPGTWLHLETKGKTKMKLFAAVAILLTLLAAGPAAAQGIEISPNGSRPSTLGSAESFTGSVVIDPLFGATAHTRATASQVTFQPGARTAWHSHPAGQTLIVTSGTEWVQEWGGARREIRPGDVIWTPPGVKHWHGGTATSGMSHVAIQETVNGEVVRWMEHVSDEQYHAGAEGALKP